MTLLQTDGLEKSFGAVQALDHPDISVQRGEIVGLIGPNGAGKSTFFNALTGVDPPDAGTVWFDGEDITGLSPDRVARRGLVRTFQQTREIETMTVIDNVRLGGTDRPGERTVPALINGERTREREAEVTTRATELLEFFDLDHMADSYASSLSGGQRKLLEIARALMLEPNLFVLDEPLAGVNPTLGQSITEYIGRLNDDGMTFVIIEHDIEALRGLVDRLVVMHQGRVLAEGDPVDILSNDRVVDAYLGDMVAETPE
jgi:branched-chain amino acid transport system ATP-binding protein